MSAKFDLAGLQKLSQAGGWDRDLCCQRRRIKVDVTQQLVTPERAVAVENFAALAEQIADSPGLVADREGTVRETIEKKRRTRRREARGKGRTEYSEMTHWQ